MLSYILSFQKQSLDLYLREFNLEFWGHHIGNSSQNYLAVINLRIGDSIVYCKEVQGFREHWRCYKAIGEAKFKIQKAGCKEKVLYQIYLDPRKAYDSIHREGVLALLDNYDVCPNII